METDPQTPDGVRAANRRAFLRAAITIGFAAPVVTTFGVGAALADVTTTTSPTTVPPTTVPPTTVPPTTSAPTTTVRPTTTCPPVVFTTRVFTKPSLPIVKPTPIKPTFPRW